jgi:hypothetical protein
MGMRVRILVFTAGGVLAGARLLAADDASFSKDLMATIALQGMPCDQLIDSKRNGDSDYTATCKDGNRYHIYVNAQGRVIVQKLTGK